ncbi:MAG TPA: hypothetical protein VEO01_31750 [Pseudonocardiaceae bacterium]|nr:hypothetical protein [Pseudonocardiaceae bacterium]
MCRRHRRVPLLSILGRLGWARDPDSWTTACRDGRGRRSTVVVRLGYGFVTMQGPSLGLVYLTPLQVGRLRDALKNAGLDLDLLGGPGLPTRTPPAEEPDGASVPAQTRRSIPLSAPAKPTVADIVARLMTMAAQTGPDESSRSAGT